jgi:uncharacterized membrane protein
MQIRTEVLLTILGMAVATYLARAGGLWLMNRVTLSPRLQRAMRTLPATVLVAIVAPIIFSGDLAIKVASAVTVLVSLRTANVLVAMLAGVATVALVRAVAG